MPETLDRLLREHRDLEKLIAVLERQTAALERGDSPDFPLLQSVLQYMANYPDLLHHPREELVYGRLKLRDPALVEEISGLLDEHCRLETMARQFTRLIEAGMQRHDAPLDRMAELAREYVDLYRRHMALEDRELFPRAMEILNDADWNAIEGALSPQTDPLFNGAVAAQYQTLHHEIMRFES